MTLPVNDVVLAGNYIYAFSRNSWGELSTVNVMTGTVSLIHGTIAPSRVPSTRSGEYIYTEAGVKIDVSAGMPVTSNFRNFNLNPAANSGRRKTDNAS